MPTRPKKSKRLPVAEAWPAANLSDEEFAHWVETHSLEKLIGTAHCVPIKPAPRTLLEETKRKQEAFDRLLIALGISRQDLRTARRIAREKAIPYTTLLRSWIRQGLKREQRRTAG
jgi:hypothetical protein